MYEIMGVTRDFEAANSPNLWVREALPNTLTVRVFYSYRSRLLQGGLAALFGAKSQELMLKLSFGLANASGPAGPQLQLPDILELSREPRLDLMLLRVQVNSPRGSVGD
ncbi:hypothetical protein F5Y18DRAFT_439476 [Xylariaceae sp. FL1019]|nr:hypothetical protein F5Y18DRAFT_439476 [Xylariaceae sp. FL1019]